GEEPDPAMYPPEKPRPTRRLRKSRERAWQKSEKFLRRASRDDGSQIRRIERDAGERRQISVSVRVPVAPPITPSGLVGPGRRGEVRRCRQSRAGAPAASRIPSSQPARPQRPAPLARQDTRHSQPLGMVRASQRKRLAFHVAEYPEGRSSERLFPR